MNLFDLLITTPLGFIIELIYKLVQNYGLSIIIFTIIIKLVLLPLNIKSQKSMKKQQAIAPLLSELQTKYKNDPEKLQAETMKVYKENNVSLAGGCMPMFIQMPIIIGLYQVIQKPLSFLMHVDWMDVDVINKVYLLRDTMVEKFPDIIGNLATQTEEMLAKTSQIQLSSWSEKINGITDPWVINFNFLGMDLSNPPMVAVKSILAGDFSNLSVLLLISIPIFAIITTWLTSRLSQKMSQPTSSNGSAAPANDSATQMTKSMTMMMPIMTGFFTFTLPSGLGIYWIVSNVMQIVQQVLLNKYFEKKVDDFNVKIPEKRRKNSKKRK